MRRHRLATARGGGPPPAPPPPPPPRGRRPRLGTGWSERSTPRHSARLAAHRRIPPPPRTVGTPAKRIRSRRGLPGSRGSATRRISEDGGEANLYPVPARGAGSI